MNYRHAYHAGNFADVVKHVVLARVIAYMTQKPQPFRVIDTHAGAGLYDLAGAEAAKTGEWRDGVARLFETDIPAAVAPLLAPYLEAVRAVNAPGDLRYYPGSPLMARHLMRRGDPLVANELRPEDCAALKAALKGAPDRKVDQKVGTKVLAIDGWQAVKSLLPPPERRGVILIDPPFEDAHEFENLKLAAAEGLRRFASGVFLIWYPVKNREAANRFLNALKQPRDTKVLDVRLSVCTAEPGLGLTETGVVIVNPPFTLAAELAVVLPFLASLLSVGKGSGYDLS